MNRTLAALAGAAALTMPALAVLAPAAQAQTRTFRDPAHDVQRLRLDNGAQRVEPARRAEDITAVTVTYARHAVEVRVKMRTYTRPHVGQLDTEISFRTPRQDYAGGAQVLTFSKHGERLRAWTHDDTRCAGATSVVHHHRGVVRLHFPASCLHNSPRVKVSVFTYKTSNWNNPSAPEHLDIAFTRRVGVTRYTPWVGRG